MEKDIKEKDIKNEIESNTIAEAGYKLKVDLTREAKSKEVKVTLFLEDTDNKEIVIVNTYLLRNIARKEYVKDIGDRIVAFGLDTKNELKDEMSAIGEQIVTYCKNNKAQEDATVCSIREARQRVVDYVKEKNSKNIKQYWWIDQKDNVCIVAYDRLDELLKLVDCGWSDRKEFAKALKLNGLLITGKDRLQTKAKNDKWVIRIRLEEQ